jgi:hypothetical protein
LYAQAINFYDQPRDNFIFVNFHQKGVPVIIKLNILLFLLALGVSRTAFAGQVEIQSILIIPAETTIARHPKITCTIKASRTLAQGKSLDITVIAAVVRPDHVVKSWTWKKVRLRAAEIKSFTLPDQYETKLAGTYRVDFSIYSKDMKPLHSLSKTFIAVDPSLPPKKKAGQDEKISHAEVIPSGREAIFPKESRHIGVGLSVNTLNGSGGGTVLFWPFTYVGFQGSYTTGSFTIAEGRLLARLPLSSGINPYLGVGYLNVSTERTVELINIKTRFKDSGLSGVIGAEIPFGRRVSGYAEICGASIDLKKEVAGGSISGTASVKYAPVTIGIGIVYFLF